MLDYCNTFLTRGHLVGTDEEQKVGLGQIPGSSNIRSAMYECQISDTNFYPQIFGTFPKPSGDIMIYGKNDILSKYTV